MKFKFKKIAALLLALCMLLTLASCVKEPTHPTTDEPDNALNIGTFTPTGPIKNVILIIGDGMGKNHIASGALDRGSAYDFQSWQRVDVNTDSVDMETGEHALTDSAASATAMATGTLTQNKFVGIDTAQNNLATIMDYAKASGKSTGIVTSDYLYGATPAGFSAHSDDRSDSKAITESQLQSGINFLAGLNSTYYELGVYEKIIKNSPYYFSNSLTDAEIAKNENVMLSLNIENGEKDSVSLSDVTKAALDFLEEDNEGFVLMIEQAYIDKYSSNNKFGDMVSRMHSLGNTVDAVMEWVGDRTDTVVIVTADHETGGLNVSSDTELQSIYNGQNGSIYYSWAGSDHTHSFVDLYVWGTNEKFDEYSTFKSGELIKNTDIFTLMKRLVTTGEPSPAA